MKNFQSNTIWTGDNLYIMRGMNSATIDLIYLDPPFNSKANYAAPIGSQAAGAAFKDTWTLDDVDIEWLDAIQKPQPALWRVLMAAMKDSDKSYLVYMAIRLMEMKRILKQSGSIYLHCDPTMSHYLKLVMDAIFGRDRFLNEIIWSYGLGGSSPRFYSRKHDVILLYSKEENYLFDKPLIPATSQMLSGQMKGATDVWDIPTINNMAKERTGYPTQKPIALLNRVIQASSPEEGVVLDPFCGCATTCVAAHNYGRDWVGIDISDKAADLVVDRISDIQGTLFQDVIHRTDVPQRNDLGKLPPYNCSENKEKLYGKQRGYCASPECNTHFEMRHLEVDHIIAQSKGGTDHIDNLQLLCGSCNRIKGNRGMEYLRKRLRFAS